MNANGVDQSRFDLQEIVAAYDQVTGSGDDDDYHPDIVRHVLESQSFAVGDDGLRQVSARELTRLITRTVFESSQHNQQNHQLDEKVFVARVQNEVDRVLGADTVVIEMQWIDDLVLVDSVEGYDAQH